MLALRGKIWFLHVGLLSLYYLMWMVYEVTYTAWMLDPNSKHDVTDTNLKLLAATELIFNIASVAVGCLLFYMVDQMTV